jgi:hypothetical protein
LKIGSIKKIKHCKKIQIEKGHHGEKANGRCAYWFLGSEKQDEHINIFSKNEHANHNIK